MNLRLFHTIVICVVSICSAGGSILTPQNEADFKQRLSRLEEMGISLDLNNATPQEQECLQMLYAYMPLSDITNRSTDFYINEAVRPALKARQEMPWGSTVPDREFRHFVLPLRVNNEALDSHRPQFYAELRDRVKDLPMKDAILEINHWCHEKVTYQPSDGRTHSPLQSVSSAIGRCGEESTFTVAALRAMGIPARQVYTPRWAHTDDNHAWVEAWADGQWYFLGACEPEPVLNLGWFNAPAARGMLMHARVFGLYDGEEEILAHAGGNTDINVTANYAPVDTITVKVLDAHGRSVSDASVSFRLYNYAEFYPISSKRSDANGEASLICGLGDLLVWATDGNRYGFRKVSVGKERQATVTLSHLPSDIIDVDLDIVPPPVRSFAPDVTAEMRAANDVLMAREDSIRQAYTSTFIGREQSDLLAASDGLDPDRLWNVLSKSRGNHPTLTRFIAQTPESEKIMALRLLETLTDKDLTDVTTDVLLDHLLSDTSASTFHDRYVMSPRIALEELTPFRSFLLDNITPKEREQFRADPQRWVEWVGRNIHATQAWYPSQYTMNPEAVWTYRFTSPESRDIFFVAGARAMGIPARIDPVTGKTQWADANEQWLDASFETAQPAASTAGDLSLAYEPTTIVPDPQYFAHYTISKLTEGEPQLLNYPDFAPWSELFRNPADIDAGSYVLVTGQRLANGGVLAHLKTLTIADDANVVDTLIVRHDDSQVQVIGSFNSENRYLPLSEEEQKSILSTTGRGYYILGIIKPNHEPSNHALRDIAAMKDAFESAGHKMILLYDNADEASRADMSVMPSLPSTATFGCDVDGINISDLKAGLNLDTIDYPLFIIADTFNRVVFVTSGYNIGTGQQLLDTLKRL